MIKINDRFSYDRDSRCWRLHETVRGENKDGKPTENTYITYFPKLEHLFNMVIDKSAGFAANEGMSVLNAINFAKTEVIYSLGITKNDEWLREFYDSLSL